RTGTRSFSEPSVAVGLTTSRSSSDFMTGSQPPLVSEVNVPAAGPSAVLPPRHDDARHRARTADVVRQRDLGILHLALAAVAAQLLHALVDHAHAGRADRVAERLEPAARVDRHVAVDPRAALLDHLPALALLGEA